jgi:LPS-assembly lipoprotein
MKTMRLMLSMIVLGSLASCGFALRGSVDIPGLEPLYVENFENGTPIQREVLRVLVDNKVALAGELAPGGYALAVGGESSNERALSVNANARAGEYEISMVVQFQLRRGAEAVLPPQTLATSKVYLADPENAIAKNEEAEIIRTEMRRELGQLILRRLQAVQL